VRKLLSVLLSLVLVITLLPPVQASANEDLPFDDYGVRTDGQEAYQQLLAVDEWESFKKVENVPLTKEWTINFSEIATANKIKAITIEHNAKQIQVVPPKYSNSKIVTVKPAQNYLGGQDYTLKILLTNGKKYKMDFTTVKRNLDIETDNNDYTTSKLLFIGETIQGNLPVNDKTDFYKINVPEDGLLNVNIKRLDTTNTVSLYLYGHEGDDGDLLAYTESKTAIQLSEELKKGEYYIQVTGSGHYEVTTNLTPKKVDPAKALQNAQQAVNNLPAPMDVTVAHNEKIRAATVLVASAKALGADAIAIEKLEIIIAALKKVVLPVEITNVTVLNSTTFEVRFNRAVDASVALFTVKGATPKAVTFNINKTVAKVEMAGNLTSGTHEVIVKGLAAEDLKYTIKDVEAEKVGSIEILGDYANRTAIDQATIDYKVKNQYGEDITDTTTARPGAIASTTAPGTVVNKAVVTSNGKVTITTTGAKEGDSVTLTLTHGEISVTKTVEISAQASVEGIKITGVYNAKGDTLKETTNLDTSVADEKFYLLIEATDQHGGFITDLSILNTPNVIRLDHTDPTVVKFAATTEFEKVEINSKDFIGLPLTGAPKLGETVVTLTAIASGKKASHKVIVAESTRTDEIELVVPTLITAGEDLFITINAKNKEGKIIDDLTIIESAVSGIKFTVAPTIPYTIEKNSLAPHEIRLKFDKSKVIGGSFTIKAESSTKKVVTKTITVKGKAIPTTWAEIPENSIRKDINLVAEGGKAPQKIDKTKVQFIDQYGNPINEFPAGYSLVVTDANPSGGVVSVVNNTITPIAVGTEIVTIGIKNGTTVVAGSERTIKFTVVYGDYIAYEVEDIGIVYDEIAARKTASVSAYDKAVNVYGVLSDGTKILLKYGEDFALNAVHPTLRNDIQVDGILKIDTTTDKYSYGSANEINTEVTVIINSSEEKYKQMVTISKVEPKVVEIQSSLQTIPYDATIAGAGSFDFAKLLGAVTNITAIDQYGVESEKLSTTTNRQFAFPDKTSVDSEINFTTVTGNHLFENNNTKDAKVTDFSSKSSFNAVVSVGNISSNVVKVTVEKAHMPTVKAEIGKITKDALGTLDNSSDVLKKAQGLVGTGYTVTIKSSSNSAISINGKVTQQNINVIDDVEFTVKNTTKPLLNIDGTVKLTVSAALEVILAAESLGTADSGKIIGLSTGIKYVVTEGTNFFGVLANGALSDRRATKADAEVLAVALTDTEITGLKNGTSYKVEIVAAKVVIVEAGSETGATAGDKIITGLIAETKYVVSEGNNFYGVLANGGLSAAKNDRVAAGALAVALSGTTITGLINGTTYKVEIAPPVALTGVTATAGDKTATIRFTAPTGANTVIVQQKTDDSSWSNAITGLDATSTTATVTAGLTNGIPYQFRVVVTGGAYDGTSNVTVAVTPVAPLTEVTAIAGDKSATIRFTPPTGATTVKIEQSTNGTIWTVAITDTLGAASTTATATGLTNGTRYQFRVVVVGGEYAGTSKIAANIIPQAKIATGAIAGITAPVKGASPVTTIKATTEYTATITWDPNDTPFIAGTVFTATIIITPKAGYTLEGVNANFFTVFGAGKVTNAANSGVVTAEFPATEALPIVPE